MRFSRIALSSCNLLAAMVVCLCSCGREKQREWGVLSGVPESVSTKYATQTAVYYVLIQTHEPILRLGDGQNYTSSILKRWHRGADYTEYSFCPDTALKFNEKAPLTLEYFSEHIRQITGKYTQEFSVLQNGECVGVRFPVPRKGYLDFLTAYTNAPTIKTSAGVEDGLGQFTVKSLGRDKLVLERKKAISNGYNKIVIYDYKGKSDPNLQNRNIADFNMIDLADVPEWAKKDYVPFTNVELTVVSLVLNIPDMELRRQVYNCIDIPEFRKAFMPGKSDYYDIGNVLPLGVPGAKAGKPAQSCNAKGLEAKKIAPISFANWRRDNYMEMSRFAEKFYNKTGIPFKVVNWEPAELMPKLHKPNRPFNLVPIIMNTVRPEFSDFLFYTIEDIGYFNFDSSKITASYKKLLIEDDPDKKEKIAGEITKELSDEGLVLPLFQNRKVLYYPREIKNLDVGKGFLEFPMVADLRW